MSLRKKWEHIWMYYKWYILAVLVLLLVNHISEVASRVDPDFQVAIVTGKYVTEETCQQLEEILEGLWPDANEDGQVKIGVNFYQYETGANQTMDPATVMAGAVQLMGDLETRMSVCFLSDNPTLLLDNDVLKEYGLVEDSVLTGLTELEGFTLVGYPDANPVQSLMK